MLNPRIIAITQRSEESRIVKVTRISVMGPSNEVARFGIRYRRIGATMRVIVRLQVHFMRGHRLQRKAAITKEQHTLSSA
jgi:hypothetical protein